MEKLEEVQTIVDGLAFDIENIEQAVKEIRRKIQEINSLLTEQPDEF